MADNGDDLLDYEEEDELTTQPIKAPTKKAAAADKDKTKEVKKGSYVGIHSTGFRDFLLKPELLRAIVDCGFEHPSEGWSFVSRRSPEYPLFSSTRMYSTSYSGYGRSLPGQIGHG